MARFQRKGASLVPCGGRGEPPGDGDPSPLRKAIPRQSCKSVNHVFCLNPFKASEIFFRRYYEFIKTLNDKIKPNFITRKSAASASLDFLGDKNALYIARRSTLVCRVFERIRHRQPG